MIYLAWRMLAALEELQQEGTLGWHPVTESAVRRLAQKNAAPVAAPAGRTLYNAGKKGSHGEHPKHFPQRVQMLLVPETTDNASILVGLCFYYNSSDSSSCNTGLWGQLCNRSALAGRRSLAHILL
jgi:hypothetical protein